jgi:hypothetical protein
MLKESFNNYFIIAAIAVGIIAILINWFYVIETAKGIYITEYDVLKKYVNLLFGFSLLMLVILWFTTVDLDAVLLNCFRGLTAGWIVTIIASLIISGIAKTEVDYKKTIWKVMLPCVVKVVILVAVLWLIY